MRPDGQNSVISFVISKWLLPELSFSDCWSRGTKTLGTRLVLWETCGDGRCGVKKRSNCRIPCHFKGASLKSVDTWICGGENHHFPRNNLSVV